MFRVPVNTVTRRPAALGLLVVASGLSACGDDQGDGNASSADSGTTAAATTPVATAKPDGTGDTAPDGTKYAKLSPARQALVSDHAETATSVKRTSEAAISSSAIDADVAELMKSLKAQGLSPQRAKDRVAANDESSTTIVAGRVRVLLFPSERKAAVQARNFQQLVNLRPGFSRADRVGNHVWLYIKPKVKYTDSDLRSYRKIRDRAERAV